MIVRPQIPWLHTSDPCEISSCQFQPGILASWHLPSLAFVPAFSLLFKSSPDNEVGCPGPWQHPSTGQVTATLAAHCGDFCVGRRPFYPKMVHLCASEDEGMRRGWRLNKRKLHKPGHELHPLGGPDPTMKMRQQVSQVGAQLGASGGARDSQWFTPLTR